ncbi:MAG: hypothetical protein ABIF77_10015 [bacterium]
MCTFKRILILLLLGSSLTLFFGCAGRDDMFQLTPEYPYVFPDTPEKLMENFVQAYGDRDLEAYSELLHEDFTFVFQPADVEKLQLEGDSYTKEDELAVAANMFSGEPVKKADGRILPAIDRIEFLNFEPLGGWEPSPDQASFPGTLRCPYRVSLAIRRVGASSLEIEGVSIFHVVSRDVRDDEKRSYAYYQLAGWIDCTQGSEVETD